jgi:hypothetical protein
MRTLIIILLLSLTIQVHAQTELPQKIRISQGHCASPCGYDQGFHDLVFNHQLEYSLVDSTFRYRKNINKEFRKFATKPSKTFNDSTNYFFLDSLFQNFTALKTSPGKYFIYRIELIYCTSITGLPTKTKTMDFFITTNPDKIHPKFIDTIIEEYDNIIKNAL